MTQILCALTHDYVLFASDRLLTWAGVGPNVGAVFEDDECKLVSVENAFAVAYSGPARISGMPMHIWIARKLAEAEVRVPVHAMLVLEAALNNELPRALKLLGISIIIAGWIKPEVGTKWQPFALKLDNTIGPDKKRLAMPSMTISRYGYLMPRGTPLRLLTTGVPLARDRETNLGRWLRRFARHHLEPETPLRRLVEEVVHTSQAQSTMTVGTRVLTMCIPKCSLLSPEGGYTYLVSAAANSTQATFAYFDSMSRAFVQQAPTVVCDGYAATDINFSRTDAGTEWEFSSRVLRKATHGRNAMFKIGNLRISIPGTAEAPQGGATVVAPWLNPTPGSTP